MKTPAAESEADRLLTQQEAEVFLHTSRTTIWRLRKRGALPFHRVGGELRYRLSELQGWLDEHGPPVDANEEIELDAPQSPKEERWRELLCEQDWGFHDADTGAHSHFLHPYPAKFPPPLPARLIEILTSPGDTVLDPFCGSGTTLVEAVLRGRNAVGVDLNPIGVLASRAKTEVLAEKDMEQLSDLLSVIGADAAAETNTAPLLSGLAAQCTPAPPPEIPNYDKWFEPIATRELGIILARIEQLTQGAARTMARACASAILVSVSNQDSETRYTSKPKAMSAADVLHRFQRKLGEAIRIQGSWKATAPTGSCRVLEADSRRLTSDEVGLSDALVTSPPYANAFDYHLYHRHRMFWLGHDPRTMRKSEIGSHLNHQQEADGVEAYRADMAESLAAAHGCLRAGAPCAFVVGDSVFHGETVNNALLLAEAGQEAGYRVIAVAERPIHPIKRSMIAPARRARIERIVLMVR